MLNFIDHLVLVLFLSKINIIIMRLWLLFQDFRQIWNHNFESVDTLRYELWSFLLLRQVFDRYTVGIYRYHKSFVQDLWWVNKEFRTFQLKLLCLYFTFLERVGLEIFNCLLEINFHIVFRIWVEHVKILIKMVSHFWNWNLNVHFCDSH
jgi:hypothetical protein